MSISSLIPFGNNVILKKYEGTNSSMIILGNESNDSYIVINASDSSLINKRVIILDNIKQVYIDNEEYYITDINNILAFVE